MVADVGVDATHAGAASGTGGTGFRWSGAPRMHCPRHLSAVVFAGILAAAGAGCRDAGPRDTVSRIRANCVVVLLDAAAAGHFGIYGYRRGTTPNIDALAADGVVFERAYSQASSTSISVPSFFSGFYSHTIARRYAKDLADRPTYLAETFRAAGFRTAGFSESPFVRGAGAAVPVSLGPGRTLPRDAFATNQGFDDFVERKPAEGSQALVADALAWLRANHQSRFYVYVHLLRPHNPYQPPDEIAQRFRPASYRGTLVPDTDTLSAIDVGAHRLGPGDLDFVVSQYDANLSYGDQLVGELARGLDDLGVLDRTVIVVMADHGEAFGQHGRFLHNTTLYEEMIRVPFIFRLPPGVAIRARRVSQPVALIDLFPTLADLFSLPAGKSIAVDGVSLVPEMEHPETPSPHRLIFTQAGNLVAVTDGSFKYVVALAARPEEPPPREELYFLPEDPGEHRDVSARHENTTRAMRAAVMSAVDIRIPQQSLEATLRALDDEKQRELRALGYVQ
jgi:arylsulfatase A-like enzyme